MDDLRSELVDAIAVLDEERAAKTASSLIEQGLDYHDLLTLLSQGVSEVGSRFENGDYFIGDLIVAGMVFRDIIKLFPPEAKRTPRQTLGRVVIGVVKNDIHDIGKDIVVDVLQSEGFEVIDLGVDVKPERFVRAVQTYKPDILLLSGMLRVAQSSMETTMRKLDEAGLRSGLTVIIGGGCTSQALCDSLGADWFAKDPMQTLEYCKRVTRG